MPSTVSASAAATSILPGGQAGATVTISPAGTAEAHLEYRDVGGSTWTSFAVPFEVNGSGVGVADAWEPSRTYVYRVRLGSSTYSNEFTIAVVPTVTPNASVIPSGGLAGVTVDVAPGESGPAYLRYRVPGGSWNEFAEPFTVTNGEGSTAWSPSQTYDYQVRYGSTYSSVYTVAVEPVVATPDASSIPAGGLAGLTVTAAPGANGSAYIQYRVPGAATWTEFATPVTVTGGTGHSTWEPSTTYEYRVRYGNTYSPWAQIEVVPSTVSATPAVASILPGASAGATVTVSPGGLAEAHVEYRDVGGSTWTSFTQPIGVTAGTGSTTWAPSKTYEYRVRVGSSHYSNTFTVAVVPTLTPVASSIPSGGVAGVALGAAPGSSGSAYLQYRLPGATSWNEFATSFPVVNGAGSTTWSPSSTYEYRVRYGSTYSAVVTIAVA